MKKKLQSKIYLISRLYNLPLDAFFNDIQATKNKEFDKKSAYKDLEKIADYIKDLHKQIEALKKE